MNVVGLAGRLANEPVMTYTATGMPVTKFRIGVDRGVKTEGGERQTDWLSVVCFQKTAEFVAQWCDKGMMVGVEGRVQSRSWEGQDGKRQYAVEIIANNVRFLETKTETERRRAAKGEPAAGAAAGPGPEEDHGPIADGEDPFGNGQ